VGGERFLTAQADRFAGAKRKKKVGSLRSEWPAFEVLRRVSLGVTKPPCGVLRRVSSGSAGLELSQDSSLRSE